VAAKHITERAFVNALHEIRNIATARGVRALESRYNLAVMAALPLDLPTDGMPKLAAFYRHHGRRA
jgi:hypothetical protein